MSLDSEWIYRENERRFSGCSDPNDINCYRARKPGNLPLDNH